MGLVNVFEGSRKNGLKNKWTIPCENLAIPIFQGGWKPIK